MPAPETGIKKQLMAIEVVRGEVDGRTGRMSRKVSK